MSDAWYLDIVFRFLLLLPQQRCGMILQFVTALRSTQHRPPPHQSLTMAKQEQKASSSKITSQPSTSSNTNDESVGFPSHLLKRLPPSTTSADPLIKHAVYVARHALSSAECQAWVKYAEEGNGGRWDKVSHPATKYIAHRECGRLQKNDTNTAQSLYNRIRIIVQEVASQVDIFDKASLPSLKRKINTSASMQQPKYQPVSCNPNLRLYKYTKGQWFGRHVDDSNKINFASVQKQNNGVGSPFSLSDVKEAQTEMTVLFYLSSCRGGATRFHLPTGKQSGKGKKADCSVAFVPEEGAVLVHVHGDHCLEHEAEPVLDGVKYG